MRSKRIKGHLYWYVCSKGKTDAGWVTTERYAGAARPSAYLVKLLRLAGVHPAEWMDRYPPAWCVWAARWMAGDDRAGPDLEAVGLLGGSGRPLAGIQAHRAKVRVGAGSEAMRRETEARRRRTLAAIKKALAGPDLVGRA